MTAQRDLVKDYLHIDADITDDDYIIDSLMAGAVEYIEQATGKKFIPENKLFALLRLLLVAHWYSNRTNETARSGNENTHSITAILTAIKYDSRLEAVI